MQVLPFSGYSDSKRLESEAPAGIVPLYSRGRREASVPLNPLSDQFNQLNGLLNQKREQRQAKLPELCPRT
jgi:hypothetical protein